MGAVARLVAELRHRGATVHEWSGWDGRGNEGVKQIDPKGAIIHHTATAYGSAFPDLVSSTQPWARGNALCNFAGNSDGSFTVLASGIGWHAGQGAGPSLGKLAPWRNRLNYYAVGLEIVYPGDKPMTAAQYRSALLFARTVADLFGGGDIACVRAHAETNGSGGDGKWDPGFAPGRTIDMTNFRREAAAFQEDDMPSAQEIAEAVHLYRLTNPNTKEAQTNEVWVTLTNGHIQDLKRQVAGLTAAVDKLAGAVAAENGIDAGELKRAVMDGIAESVVEVKVVQGGGS